MQLFFSWSDFFNEKADEWHSDADIISLEISHRESCFASAKILIFNKNIDFSALQNKKYAKIGVKFKENKLPKLLFFGRLVTFPLSFSRSALKIELISEPAAFEQQLNKFIKKNLTEYKNMDNHIELTKITFDDLFFSERDAAENPSVFLEGDTKFFFWDMRSGQLALSDINCGDRNISITCNQILKDSFRIRLAREPYRNVKISISAEWIQHLRGYLNVMPLIAQKFKSGVINSFTNIKTGIEKLFANQSGYNLIEHKINEIIPDSLPQSEEIETARGKVKLHRFYFDGFLVIGWHLKQKRVETVVANVVNSHQDSGREKSIHINLNAIQLQKEYMHWRPFWNFKIGDKVIYGEFIFECAANHFSSLVFDEKSWNKVQKVPDALQDDSAASFFSTPRGKNAIRYALQKAIALINYSARYIEVTFSVDAKDFLFVSLNDQITITDPRFKNGSISGKVVKTTFIANDKHKIMQITIGCREENFRTDISDQLNKYCSELQIEEEKSQITADDIITDINVENPPEEQERILSSEPLDSVADLRSKLLQHKTKIKLKLHPLNTTKSKAKTVVLPDFIIQ